MDWLITNKDWVFSGVGVLLLSGLFTLSWRKREHLREIMLIPLKKLVKILDKEPPPTPPPPKPYEHDDRLSLHKKLGVRPLSDLENGLSIDRLPCGVFGFVTSWTIDDPHGLHKHPEGTACFEIVKCKDASLKVVGYTGNEGFIALTSVRDLPARVILTPVPHKEFLNIVSISLEDIKSSDHRYLPDHTDIIELVLKPTSKNR